MQCRRCSYRFARFLEIYPPSVAIRVRSENGFVFTAMVCEPAGRNRPHAGRQTSPRGASTTGCNKASSLQAP